MKAQDMEHPSDVLHAQQIEQQVWNEHIGAKYSTR